MRERLHIVKFVDYANLSIHRVSFFRKYISLEIVVRNHELAKNVGVFPYC